MKVIDLVIKQFNYELKDKTIFKVLNQEHHDKYIYNIDANKFHKYRDSSGEMEDISLIVNETTVNWEIELIEEKKIELPEKIEIEQDTPSSNFYIRNEFGTKCGLTKHSKMIAERLNETLDYLKYKEEESEKC